jgi:hypothetical protein
MLRGLAALRWRRPTVTECRKVTARMVTFPGARCASGVHRSLGQTLDAKAQRLGRSEQGGPIVTGNKTASRCDDALSKGLIRWLQNGAQPAAQLPV